MIKWFERHYRISWIITFLIAIIIFYISSLTFQPLSGSGGGIGLKALLYHIIAFFLLAFFLSVSLVKGKNLKYIFIAIIAAVLYGISDEIHQSFVPGRVPSFFDLFLNTSGIILAITIYIFILALRKD